VPRDRTNQRSTAVLMNPVQPGQKAWRSQDRAGRAAASWVAAGTYQATCGELEHLETLSGTGWEPIEAPLPANASTTTPIRGPWPVACPAVTTCVATSVHRPVQQQHDLSCRRADTVSAKSLALSILGRWLSLRLQSGTARMGLPR
jgi:hypothetical protein